jgi:hypothetical protein
MGNRCSRWIARTGVDAVTASVMFPLGLKLIAPHLDQNSRPIIVAMGFLRAVLPFALSFQGSRIGRQLTFNTWKFANYRWSPVQSVMDFNKNSGVYQDSDLEPFLVEIAHSVAEAIGHGMDPSDTRKNLASLGFDVVGSGRGGYAAYRRRPKTMDGIEKLSATTTQPLSKDDCVIWLHVAPYGPSILNEVPRYIVLERKRLPVTDAELSSTILAAAIKPEASICGFTYSGAYFQSQEWAALTNRFRDTLVAYSASCKKMGTTAALRGSYPVTGPPRDLSSLKEFIRHGTLRKKQRKDKKRWKTISNKIGKVGRTVSRFQKMGTAPKKVIVYLEGLDCSAKSSTGGLVCTVLEQCGYSVRTAQHNRPPTPEQQQQPWMDRGRFEYPQDVYGPDDGEVPEYTALVWDRGPAGDFVYGKFTDLSMSEKLTKYEEFREFDANCRRDDVLLLKLLFVADKDSIASTLGKRLAHKQIVQDLRIWLDANSVPHNREGLDGERAVAYLSPSIYIQFLCFFSILASCSSHPPPLLYRFVSFLFAEIEHHIDPTDFVAFNKFKRNLSIFTDFARNTDSVYHSSSSVQDNYDAHWTVVNTCRRYPARLQLLATFERQMKRYALTPTDRSTYLGRFLATIMDRKQNSVHHVTDHDGHHQEVLPQNYVEDKQHGISIRAVFQSILLVGLLYFYAHITWKFDIMQYGIDLDNF